MPPTAQPPRHVLVTGAAGTIGRGVLWALRRAGIASTVLVLDDPGDLDADRVVLGTATDRDRVRDALDGADAVVHLAALAAPHLGTADAVFGGNTAATFTVLDAAGRAGVRRAAIASSINALGVLYSPVPAAPAYFPLEVEMPTAAADPYSLSKRVDEEIARAMHRAYGMDVIALRYPMTGGLGEEPGLGDRLLGGIANGRANPAAVAADGWSYLEVRDAARAALAALSPRRRGAFAVHVAAPTTYLAEPTEAALDRYWPGVPRRRPIPGRDVPIDLRPAQDLLGFNAEHVVDPESD
ncbi:NAD-dependent epimerase/dehydratase family protein [Occultella kanbiaonis]|uniref:NAD-dependent epimerase/dehydratase family protein n=1 Tax=Occultella kanbiaonis TaxID=2675754 RepID=UPI0013D2BC3D|nr:NAD(P)-dependent oxidoreductase [Occultella kanbiaonis]